MVIALPAHFHLGGILPSGQTADIQHFTEYGIFAGITLVMNGLKSIDENEFGHGAFE
jgi:hypothetical protein